MDAPHDEPTDEQIEALFFDALELPEDKREAFLEQKCNGQPRLRQAVDALLAADAEAGGQDFLQSAFFDAQQDAVNHADDPQRLNADELTDHSGRFEILGRHQQGGLGEVLIAYDRQLKRDVAIKQIQPRWQNHEEAKQRFIREAEVTGRLEHPGVVPVYAMGTWDDGRHYYAMRFIEGQTLKEAIQRFHQSPTKEIVTDSNEHTPAARDDVDQTLAFRQLLRCFIDVCNTISYAHDRRILHRDLKPANIMVGPYGETLVVDWGLAKLLDAGPEDSMTEAFASGRQEDDAASSHIAGTVGTPQYMSPEQARGQLDEIGIRTDVYLLGATLYQILTGQPPHPSDSIVRMLKRIAAGEFPHPSSVAADVPPALAAICTKAMATDSINRYRQADALALDVERWLADEPVSVYRESPGRRIARWLRHHPAAAASLIVATLLLTVGSFIGAVLWNEIQIREFQSKQEQAAKELELAQQTRQRVAELKSAAARGKLLAGQELQAGRFSSALSILRGVSQSLSTNPALASEFDDLSSQANRVHKIVRFYELADHVQEQNVLSRDTKGIIAATEALEQLGVAQSNCWWDDLPVEDLTAAQADQLRWDVYQQWLILDAMLTKTIGIRLAGGGQLDGATTIIKAVGRFLRTDIGKREAAASIIVSDRIDGFRFSQATRFYRSIAKMRLGAGVRLKADRLDLPHNGADAHSLGVLCMIAALDPAFERFFRGYQGEDSLLAARDTLRRGATLRPNHYWTHLALAQIEYLLADKKSNATWRDYEDAIHSVGQCIALEPERCFALADRSSMYRAQARLIRHDASIDPALREQRVAELLQWCMQDAQSAQRQSELHPWVGWQYGLALMETGQVELAVDRFIETALHTLPLTEIDDAPLVQVDDLRGRAEASKIMAGLTKSNPQSARYHSTLAMIMLARENVDAALTAAERASSLNGTVPHAHAVRGLILLRQDKPKDAEQAFRKSLESDPDHAWAHFGLASCIESTDQLDLALNEFQTALDVALVAENRAAALLGKSRVLARMGRYQESKDAITSARQEEPACDLLTVARPLARHYQQLKKNPAGDQSVEDMRSLLQFIATFPRPTNLKFGSIEPKPGSVVAILNGDFELGSLKYWSSSGGATWLTEDGFRSSAGISSKVSHTGNASLHLTADQSETESGRGHTGQEIPIHAGRTYEVTVWGKAQAVTERAFSIQSDNEQVLLEFPSGTYDWREIQGRFQTPENFNGQTLVPTRVNIVAKGSGQLWIDDLQIRLVD
ncbi:protein kinase domain-containing protein [Stieleria varia]|uniref:Serine/threonine-protein kinase PknD n=1 Tax=Stieleria varia TaxID=2528005 RepID=A0A5C6B581_9BACT|nr:protein kinase [Stieleria varia]TWU06436.1 Serine/threonine-protein kinase PknD [Stieleria varia]